MTMKLKNPETTTDSILPQQYWEKKSSQGRTWDQPHLGLLELYPAGFTKPNKKHISRQYGHRKLYEAAVTLERECALYPFDAIDHEIELVHESDNKFDKFAIQIFFKGIAGNLEGLDLDLGYVPARISRLIFDKLDKFNGGRILKVQMGIHGKYHRAKIILAYNHASFQSMLEEEMQRFASLVE